MVVAKGYKQTEVGVIPEDWEVKEFVEVMDGFSSGQTPYRAVPEFYKGDIPWITSGELNYNVITDTIEKITIEGAREANLKTIPKGTFLFAITGLEAAGTRGSCAITGIEATTNQSCMALFPKKGLLITPYLYHYYVRYGNELAFKYCQGTKQQSYTGGIAKKLPIIVPPTIEEQTAIANALSDMDALIAQTEKLIEKKKAIKQGVMQELLKPKEGWVNKKLGEVAVFRRGSFPQPYGLDKWYDHIAGKPFVQVFDVDDNKKLKPETKRYISEDAQKLSVFADKGTIVLTIQGSIGRIAITQYDAYIDRTLLIFESYKYEFNKYFFMHSIHQLFEIEKQSAPGGIIKTITKNALKKFNISYPEINEQTRIGLIIKDLENDIVTIETKLQKLKNQKQGMMQALLTGKIRLV